MKSPQGITSAVAHHRSRGFTLLEVMLAFVVFALSFATVLEIMAGSMRAVGRAGDDTEIALIAQSIIDSVGKEIPLAEGEFSGTELDGYQWQMGIKPYQPTEGNERILELADGNLTQLLRIDLDINWMQGHRQRDIHFSTVRSSIPAYRP